MENHLKLELLEKAGRAAYGKDWTSGLILNLDMDEKTIQRWVASERPVPALLIRAMVSHLRDRAALIHRIADSMLDKMYKATESEFKDIKVLFIPGWYPDYTYMGDAIYDFLCFDVDGYMYYIDSNDRIINRDGEDIEIENATIPELRAAYDAYIRDPKKQR